MNNMTQYYSAHSIGMFLAQLKRSTCCRTQGLFFNVINATIINNFSY